MPDLLLGNVVNDWIEIKTALTSINLTDVSFLQLLSKLFSFIATNDLVAHSGLEMLCHIASLSPHNMFVESCISSYDLIKDDDRSNLSRSTMNGYLMVRLNMPPLVCFDIRKAALNFLKRKNRRPHTIKMDKFKSQGWFKGVFNEADERKTCHKIYSPQL